MPQLLFPHGISRVPRNKAVHVELTAQKIPSLARIVRDFISDIEIDPRARLLKERLITQLQFVGRMSANELQGDEAIIPAAHTVKLGLAFLSYARDAGVLSREVEKLVESLLANASSLVSIASHVHLEGHIPQREGTVHSVITSPARYEQLIRGALVPWSLHELRFPPRENTGYETSISPPEHPLSTPDRFGAAVLSTVAKKLTQIGAISLLGSASFHVLSYYSMSWSATMRSLSAQSFLFSVLLFGIGCGMYGASLFLKKYNRTRDPEGAEL